MNIDRLRYPIGKYVEPPVFDPETVALLISEIEMFPSDLEELIRGFSNVSFENTYRPDGWSARQVIHHVSDSHMHAYLRVKFALMQDNPTIMPYEENDWVKTAEVTEVHPIEVVQLIAGLHKKWCALLRSLTLEQLSRTYYHPEHMQEFPLLYVLGMYAWHGKHHLAHVRIALQS